MSKPIISVEGLSKSYTISHQSGSSGQAQGYRRLSEELLSYPRQLLSRFSSLASRNSSSEEFWALKDVSFEVNEGEVVGIIGRNGAGKSTLLKILSRITEPTTGRVTLRGRVASLLEVGTGFHPELTGRENVFLNGAILGMTRSEIKRKFDEIVDFAGVEKFLDTPVKRYSSGMYVRLAFAVAAHLDPEILVVDEVLAVGDAQFQKKCLGKMGDVAKGGRTVFFVSHNMAAISALCRTAIVLDKGKIRSHGDVSSAVASYHEQSFNASESAYRSTVPKDLSRPYIQSVCVNQHGNQNVTFLCNRPIELSVEVQISTARDLACTIVLKNSAGVWVHHTSDEFADEFSEYSSRAVRRCVIPPYGLNADSYCLTVAIGSRSVGELYEKLEDVVGFKVDFEGKMAERTSASGWRGVCGPGLIAWQ